MAHSIADLAMGAFRAVVACPNCRQPLVQRASVAHGWPGLARRTAFIVHSSDYSFAQVEVKEMGRKNRGRAKKAANELRNLVDGMCHMTEKQLKAATPLTGEVIIDAVRIAARLDRTNQGRKRQESLVVKLLRTQLDEKALEKLEEAVELSRTSQNSYVDRDIQAQVDAWREGLMEGDQEVLSDVLARLSAHQARQGQPLQPATSDGSDSDGLTVIQTSDGESGSDSDSDTSIPFEPLASEIGSSSAGAPGVEGGGGASKAGLALSPQEFRSLLRQCQVAALEARELQAAAQVAAGLGTGAVFAPGSRGSSSQGNDDEDLDEILKQAAARARRSSKGRRTSGPAADTTAGQGPQAGPEPGSSGAPTGGVPSGVQAAGRRSRKLARTLNGILRQLAVATN